MNDKYTASQWIVNCHKSLSRAIKANGPGNPVTVYCSMLIAVAILIVQCVTSTPAVAQQGSGTCSISPVTVPGNAGQPTLTRHRVALVLTGGGARGLAQVGVLKVLDSAGINFDAVVGTSIGAVIGGLYCAGYTPRELDSLFRSVDWQEILGVGDETDRRFLPVDRKSGNDRSLVTLRFDGVTPQLPEAVSTGGRISRLLDRLVWRSRCGQQRSFDRLAIPFRAVATDLVAGRSVVLDSGSLSMAIRASATVPLRFSPIRIDSMMLVDGGLLANVPVDIARAVGCDVVIVVNTSSPLMTAEQLDDPLAVADQLVTVMMKQPALEQLARADIVIEPRLPSNNAWDFASIDGAVDSGEAAAGRCLGAIRSILDRPDGDIGHGEPDDNSNFHLYDGVDSVVIRGLEVLAPSLFDAEVDTALQSPRHTSGPYDLRSAIISRARLLGYGYLRIDSIVRSMNTLVLFLDEGRICSIRIIGVNGADTVVVERELGFEVGDAFMVGTADASVTRLLSTGRFQQVRLDVEYREQGGVDVVVDVVQQGTSTLRLQACVDNERYTQLAVELADESALGTGARASIRFGGGLRDQLAELSIGSIRIKASPWTIACTLYGSAVRVNRFERTLNQVEGTIARTIIGEFQRTRIGINAIAGRLVGSVALISLQGRFERQGTLPLSIEPDDPGWRGISSVTAAARIDSRDRVPYPQHGTLLDLSYETSLSLLGADKPYVKAGISGEYYARVGGSVLHPRFCLGIADLTLPPNEFFGLGGQGTMFGLRQDERRGRQLFLASIEYRTKLPLRILFDTYVALRYDLGSTWLSGSEIRLGELDHGIGFSIGLDTPIGPATFALGQSFTFNRPDRPSNYALANIGPLVAYFSIGYPLQ